MRKTLLIMTLLISLPLTAKPHMAMLKTSFFEPSDFAQDTVRFHFLVKLALRTKSWEKARSVWQNAMDIAEKDDWDKGRLEAYQGMGSHYKKKGSFLEATYYYQKGLSLSEQVNDVLYQIKCYQSLGVAYSDAGDMSRSLNAHQTASDLAKAFDRKLYMASLNEIGNVYYHAKNYSKALGYYLRCLKENQPIDSTRQCWFLLNAAGAYQELGDVRSSFKTYEELFKLGKFLTKEDSTLAYAKLGQLYNQIGNPDQGLYYGLAADRIVDVKGFYSKSLVSKTLSELYKTKANWEKAYFHLSKFQAYRDTVLSQEQRQRIEGVKVGYESEKRRIRLKFQDSTIASQKRANRFLIGGITLVGLLGCTILFFNLLLRRKGHEIELQKNEVSKLNNTLELRVEERTNELTLANRELVRKNKEIQQALLKGQTLERQRVATELHDNLGGTLTAIQWYMDSLLLSDDQSFKHTPGYVDIYEMITRAYGEVRLLAHHMMPEVLEREGLERALHELAAPINKSNRLKLIVMTKPVGSFLNLKEKFELYSIALELSTNILKHAFASEAQISLEKINDDVVMTVEDNGIGISSKIQTNRMGLNNIKTRLQSIGGDFSIISKEGAGTVVTIKIPSRDFQVEVGATEGRMPGDN
jgi:signal transduction histidine kinase